MIEINNLTKDNVSIAVLKKIAESILKKEKNGKFNLSIALVDQKSITRLNKKYRKKNKPTDVLSFGRDKSSDYQFRSSEEKNTLGEIVICLQEVAKNAKRFKFTFKKELNRVLVHGILHLLGYEHEGSEKDAILMRAKEEYYSFKI